MNTGVYIETAGIILRVVHEPEQACDLPVESDVPHFKVHILERKTRTPVKLPPGDTILLDGKDMYQGWLDMQGRKAMLFMTDKAQEDAVANALRRIVSLLCAAHGGIVLHSACMVRDNRALLFYGKSGAGKSTICAHSGKFLVLNDDLTVVKKQNSRFMAWGMPSVSGKQKSPGAKNGFAIAALFKLVQSEHVFTRPITPAQAAASLLALPPECAENEMKRILDLTADLTQNIPCYELGFTRTREFLSHITKIMDRETS